MIKIKGRVINVEKKDSSLSICVNGIKKSMAPPIGATAGSHGTYRIDYPEISHHLYVVVEVFNSNEFRSKDIKIDVRDIALAQNKWEKLTDKRVSQLKEKLIDKYVDIEHDKKSWRLVDEISIVDVNSPIRVATYSVVFSPPNHFESKDEYLQHRFKSIREYRDYLLSHNKMDARMVAQVFNYKDDFMDKPIGTEPTDSDFREGGHLVSIDGIRVVRVRL